MSRFRSIGVLVLAGAVLWAPCGLAQSSSRQQQPPPSGSSQTPPPNSTEVQQPRPGNQTPSTAAPITVTPPAPSSSPGITDTPAAPGPQQVQQPGSVQPAGQQSTPTQGVGAAPGIAPAELPTEPPPVAPNFQAPQRPLPSAERIGVDVTNQVPMSLREAVALALHNNNDIDGSRINVEIAEFDLKAARGIYDPVFTLDSYYERRTNPTSSTIGGGANGSVTQTEATGSGVINGFSPYAGGSYQLGFSSSRLTTNNQFTTLNPQFPNAFSFTYTQPLLRGLRIDNNRRQIEIAKKNLSLTDAQFRQRVIDTITQVEQSYWDLVFALRNLQVQIDAVKQARTQLESNRRLVEKGVLAPIDLVAASTQVTTFEQNVYTAQESVTKAENTLKTLILPDRTASLWARALTPVTEVALEAPRIPVEQAVDLALKNRPEISQLRSTAEINQIDTRYFRDQTKPRVDLVGSYNAAGLAGSAVEASQNPRNSGNQDLVKRVNELSATAGLPPLDTSSSSSSSSIPPNLVGGYGQSLSNLLGQDYPTYRVGVRIELPLRNRTAEANLGRSLAEGRRIGNQRAQTEQVIEADVRNTLQALSSSEARLAAAAATRSSAELQYESEQRQLRAGTTTVFLVLQRQTELLAARGRELQAQTDLNKAIADFQRATGNTLAANNISLRLEKGGPDPQLNAQPADIFPGGKPNSQGSPVTANSADTPRSE